MKIHEYNEMMSYLTRPAVNRTGFNQGTKKVAGLMEEYYGSDRLKYQEAVKNGFQGTFEEYLQWMRENAAYGGRIGFQQAGLVKHGIYKGQPYVRSISAAVPANAVRQGERIIFLGKNAQTNADNFHASLSGSQVFTISG